MLLRVGQWVQKEPCFIPTTRACIGPLNRLIQHTPWREYFFQTELMDGLLASAEQSSHTCEPKALNFGSRNPMKLLSSNISVRLLPQRNLKATAGKLVLLLPTLGLAVTLCGSAVAQEPS